MQACIEKIFLKIQKNPPVDMLIQELAMCTESFTEILLRVKEKFDSPDYAI